jgi:PKD repeat protein
MAVIADFMASSVVGESPLYVEFTDLSTGSPDHWLWNFGDGEISTSPNPSHTFTGSKGATFTITLTAWTSSSITEVPLTGESGASRDSDVQDTPAEALAVCLSESWVSHNPDKAVFRNFGYGDEITQYYEEKRYTVADITLADTPTIAAYIYETAMQNDTVITIFDGSIECKINGETMATITGAPGAGWVETIDLTSLAGTDISVELVPVEELLAAPTPTKWTGVAAWHRIRRYEGDSISKAEKTAYIKIATTSSEDAYIDFVGTPLSGTSPLEVQFTDLSVVDHAQSIWLFGDGYGATFAGETHPLHTYTTDGCSLDLL